MSVDLERAHTSANEVEVYVAAVLAPYGFADAGKTGRDQIKNERTLYLLNGPGRLQVGIDVSRPMTVPIRVNENRSTFSKENFLGWEPPGGALLSVPELAYAT